jgi:anti-sigma factor RsiW
MDAYIDGELDLRSTLEVEGHVKACPACARGMESHKALQTTVRSSRMAYTAPPALRSRILSATSTKPTVSTPWLAWRPVALGAAFASMVMIVSNNLWQWRSEDRIEQELVANHVRSLQAEHLTDVLSSDRHTVRPWFSGKLDYAPSVRDLTTYDFPLIGGRLDYVNGKPVAALVYRKAKHTINLYTWPAASSSRERVSTIRGFNIVHWSGSGMGYWAISDLNPAELSRFATFLRSRE